MHNVDDTAPVVVEQGRGEITLVKSGNLLYVTRNGVDAPPALAFHVLNPILTYTHRKFLFGFEQRTASGEKRKVETSIRRLYGVDQRGRLFAGFGMHRSVSTALREAGFSLLFRDLDRLPSEFPHARPDRYVPMLENVLRNFEFRQMQDICLKTVTDNPCGAIHAVTGFGKMAMITMICLLYNKARIHVVEPNINLTKKMVEYLTKYIPNIGMFGGGRKVMGDRITVFNKDSLHHSDFDADFLLGDEAHLLITEETSPVLSRYQRSRNYAFTATPEGRGDGSDRRLEALFGPVIFHLPYWEAEAMGLVVPILVSWSDVHIDQNPAEGYEDVEKKRWGIWFNDQRNDLITTVYRRQPEDEQKLILTDTLFHAIELYRRLADTGIGLVYDKMELSRFDKYKQVGYLPTHLPIMTPELKEQHRRRFEAGEGSYIATSVWETGIDPVHLQHVVLASPFSSEIRAQQAPGRASRTNTTGQKAFGTVHDFRDQFDPSFCAAARKRFKVYKSLRWTQAVFRDGAMVPVEG